jgi:DNA-directed RNA polymerase specialized sigma24 family protein
MSTPGSVTHWIDGLRNGESVATRKLWEKYFHGLVKEARKKLRNMPRGAYDEEDVALSAFDSFCRGAEQGRFPCLNDRDDLWQVLLMITHRKTIDHIQHAGRKIRDWRKTEPLAAEGSPGADLAGHEPDPAFAAEVAEEFQRLLGVLGDDSLRDLAVRKMEGYTNKEIAAQLNCSLTNVERRLRLIRAEWKEAADESSPQ